MTSRRRISAAAKLLSLSLCVTVAAGQASGQASSPAAATTSPSSLSAGSSPEALGDVLFGSVQPAAARAAAAASLAAARSPRAAGILAQALQSPDITIAAAAAHAIAEADWADLSFVSPLEGALGSNPALNADAVRILGEFNTDPAVAGRLVAAASNEQLPAAARTPVVRALGGFSLQVVAAALVGLLNQPDESQEVRQAAGLALTEMTGLTELGGDPGKWEAWWLGVAGQTPEAFTAALAARRSERFGQVLARSDQLDESLDRLLKSLYFTSEAGRQGQILDSYLASDAPEVRRIGAQIVEIDVGGGRPMTAAARARLLEMVGADPSAQVRAAAATALGLDPTTADVLLTRLAAETNPDARVALLQALAARPDARIVAQGLALLDSPDLAVRTAAADLIAGAGAVLNDPRQAALKHRVRAALLAELDQTPAQQPVALRRSLVAAVGALGDQDLYDRLVRLAGGDEPEGVRVEAVGALGSLARSNADIAAVLADFVDTPGTPPALRLKAVQQLAQVATTAYVDRLVDRLNRVPEPNDEIRQAIWQTVQIWLGNLSDEQVVALAARLRNEHDFAREVTVRQLYAKRLEARKTEESLRTAASQRETIATRELEDLNQPTEAAADFSQVITYYMGRAAAGEELPHNPFRGEARALLAAGPPYEPAVRYAAATLADPRLMAVMPDVLEEFPRLADALATGDPENRDAQNKALELVKAFNDAKLKIPASLSYVTDNLAAAADAARRNLSGH